MANSANSSRLGKSPRRRSLQIGLIAGQLLLGTVLAAALNQPADAKAAEEQVGCVIGFELQDDQLNAWAKSCDYGLELSSIYHLDASITGPGFYRLLYSGPGSTGTVFEKTIRLPKAGHYILSYHDATTNFDGSITTGTSSFDIELAAAATPVTTPTVTPTLPPAPKSSPAPTPKPTVAPKPVTTPTPIPVVVATPRPSFDTTAAASPSESSEPAADVLPLENSDRAPSSPLEGLDWPVNTSAARSALSVSQVSAAPSASALAASGELPADGSGQKNEAPWYVVGGLLLMPPIWLLWRRRSQRSRS